MGPSDRSERPAVASPEAVKLAAEHVPLAIETIVAVMQKPGRGAAARLRAAELLLEISALSAPERLQAPVRSLVDAKAAAEELRRRLQAQQRPVRDQ